MRNGRKEILIVNAHAVNKKPKEYASALAVNFGAATAEAREPAVLSKNQINLDQGK